MITISYICDRCGKELDKSEDEVDFDDFPSYTYRWDSEDFMRHEIFTLSVHLEVVTSEGETRVNDVNLCRDCLEIMLKDGEYFGLVARNIDAK